MPGSRPPRGGARSGRGREPTRPVPSPEPAGRDRAPRGCGEPGSQAPGRTPLQSHVRLSSLAFFIPSRLSFSSPRASESPGEAPCWEGLAN